MKKLKYKTIEYNIRVKKRILRANGLTNIKCNLSSFRKASYPSIPLRTAVAISLRLRHNDSLPKQPLDGDTSEFIVKSKLRKKVKETKTQLNVEKILKKVCLQ